MLMPETKGSTLLDDFCSDSETNTVGFFGTTILEPLFISLFLIWAIKKNTIISLLGKVSLGRLGVQPVSKTSTCSLC